MVFASGALVVVVVVQTPLYLAGYTYNDHLTSFCEPLSPPYTSLDVTWV